MVVNKDFYETESGEAPIGWRAFFMVPTTLRFESIYSYIGIQEMIGNLRNRIGRILLTLVLVRLQFRDHPHTMAAGSSGVKWFVVVLLVPLRLNEKQRPSLLMRTASQLFLRL